MMQPQRVRSIVKSYRESISICAGTDTNTCTKACELEAADVRKAEDTPVYAHNRRNRRNIDGGFEGTQNGLKLRG